MGRPKQTDPRDRQLNVALTRLELEAIRAQAARAGHRPVEYARAVLLGKNSFEPWDGPPASAERLQLEQLKRIGNNLNQIARMQNTLRVPAPPGLEPLLHDIRRMIAARGPP
jgi:hypothetical protein